MTRGRGGGAPNFGVLQIRALPEMPGAKETNRRVIIEIENDGRVSVIATCNFGPNQMRCKRFFANPERAETARIAFLGYGLEAFKASGGWES